jgi:alginate O-acetyltransferase complex protein AlgF
MFICNFFLSLVRTTTVIMLLLPSMTTQAADLLYDPEPPADSAYVRVIHDSHDSAVDVLVDNKTRIHNLASGEVGEYLVLPMGKHLLTLQKAGKAATTAKIEVDSGHLLTVAFPSLRPNTKPLIFEDKAGSNKLKALLAVYRLDTLPGTLDIVTANGNTRVFSNLAPGATGQLSVNPIAIELVAISSRDKSVLARSNLSMSPGSTYSLFYLSDAEGKLIAQAVQNKFERYTGK